MILKLYKVNDDTDYWYYRDRDLMGKYFLNPQNLIQLIQNHLSNAIDWFGVSWDYGMVQVKDYVRGTNHKVSFRPTPDTIKIEAKDLTVKISCDVEYRVDERVLEQKTKVIDGETYTSNSTRLVEIEPWTILKIHNSKWMGGIEDFIFKREFHIDEEEFDIVDELK